MVFSEYLSLIHPYLSAARSKQSDPYRMTRIDILKSFQKAQLSIPPPCDCTPTVILPPFGDPGSEKASALLCTPIVLSMLPQAWLCVSRHTHKHTQTTPSLQPPKQSLSRCPSPSVSLSMVDRDLKINKCPLSVLLSSTPD